MITSTGNARVKQLVTWQKKRKARDEEGVYIVEGIRMYREAPRAQVREVYVSEQFYSRYGEELGLSAWGRQMEILSDHVFSHSGRMLHMYSCCSTARNQETPSLES